MKKWLRLGLCLGLLTVALTCSALAVDDEYTTSTNGTVSYSDQTGKYTASYDGTASGKQYALLVVKGTPTDYSVSEDTIMYIDQKAAGADGISFDFIPKSTPDCVVLLGGEFAGADSPVVLGTLKGQGVTVSGQVSLGNTRGAGKHGGVTVTLTDKSSAETYSATTQADGSYTIDGVPEGQYSLEISAPGFLKYTKSTVEITAEQSQMATVTLKGGDINSSGLIDGTDLGIFTADFGYNAGDTETSQYSDIDGSGVVMAADLSIFLSNFGQQNIVES